MVTKLIFSMLSYSVMTILIIISGICSTSCSWIWIVSKKSCDFSKTVIAFLTVLERGVSLLMKAGS